MKIPTLLVTILFATLIAAPSFAQTSGRIARCCHNSAAPSGQPNPQEMMKQMMEMSKLNENHKLLTDLDGNWNYTIKIWMNPDPNAPAAAIQRHCHPQKRHGRSLRR